VRLLEFASCSISGVMMTEDIVSIAIKEDTLPRKRLTSNIHTYLVNAANPVVPLTAYNIMRHKVRVTSNDVAVIITQDNPPGGQVNPNNTASLAPQGASVVLGSTGNGFPGYDIYGPDPLWAVNIQGNGNCRVEVVEQIWEVDD
jgi:hypothetical protein